MRGPFFILARICYDRGAISTTITRAETAYCVSSVRKHSSTIFALPVIAATKLSTFSVPLREVLILFLFSRQAAKTANPHFSPETYCNVASTCVYCVVLRRSSLGMFGMAKPRPTSTYRRDMSAGISFPGDVCLQQAVAQVARLVSTGICTISLRPLVRKAG